MDISTNDRTILILITWQKGIIRMKNCDKALIVQINYDTRCSTERILYSCSQKYSNIYRRIFLCRYYVATLYEILWNFLSIVMTFIYRHCNSKICNKFENIYKNYKTFIANIHSVKNWYTACIVASNMH